MGEKLLTLQQASWLQESIKNLKRSGFDRKSAEAYVKLSQELADSMAVLKVDMDEFQERVMDISTKESTGELTGDALVASKEELEALASTINAKETTFTVSRLQDIVNDITSSSPEFVATYLDIVS